jgi:xanthine dehydrogenase accessory factor
MNGAIPAIAGWEILEQASELSRRGEEFALATVVWRQGPSSGQAGSRALITADGQLHGWIGGACAEPVVIRQAQKVIAEREPKLLLLGTPEQFGELASRVTGLTGGSIPEGMITVAISCQSEGALQVYIEPVLPTPQLTVVGRSPMAHTLVELAQALGWRAEVVDGPDFSAADLNAHSIVVVATQGHGDEEAVEQAVQAFPAFLGVVASRRRGEALLGTLADRGVPQHLLDRVRVPVGLDLGHTSHREIAVAILAELVQRRAARELVADPAPAAEVTDAVDPVCGMTVRADKSSRPVSHDGVTYYFCCAGCRTSFDRDPHAYLAKQEV